MVRQTFEGYIVSCDKCYAVIRATPMISNKTFRWYQRRRKFCGDCIQKRLTKCNKEDRV